MRISRYIILVIICFLSFKFAYSKDYGEKIENRLDGKVKRDWNEQNQAKGMLERHQKLAHVFDGLYLQLELADQKIDYYDVIASTWDLKDKHVLDQLATVDIRNISGALSEVEEDVKKVEEVDLKTVYNISEITSGLVNLHSITNEFRIVWREYNTKLKLPIFDLGNHEETNFATKALSFLNSLPSKDPSEVIKSFRSDLELFALKTFSSVWPEVFENIKSYSVQFLDQAIIALNASTIIYENIPFFEKFSGELLKVRDLHLKLQSLKFITETTASSITSLHRVVESLHETNSDISMSRAYYSRRKLSDTFELLKEADVLYRSGSADTLKSSLKLLERISETLLPVDQSLELILHSELRNFLRPTSLLVQEAKYVYDNDVHWYDWPCFKKTLKKPPMTVDELKEIKPAYEDLYKATLYMKDLYLRSSELQKSFSEAKGYVERAEQVKDEDSFHEWRRMGEIARLQNTLQHMEPFIESFRKESGYIESLKELDPYRDQFNSAQSWIDKFGARQLMCEPMFLLDTDVYKGYNRMTEILKKLKKGDPKKYPDFDLVPKAGAEVRKFIDSMPTGTDSEQKNEKNRLKVIRRENLLKFSFAVHSLEQIRKIVELDKELEILIEKGDEVESIRGMKRKKAFEAIWRDWPDVGEKLKKFRKSIAKMMLKIRDTPEKSLESIGQVYFEFSEVRLKGSFDLKKYRESLSFLPQVPPELEDALQKLEVPMSMDWDLVHMNFRRMPEVMRELQKDFDCFFDEEKCKEPEDRSMIMMEQYRKNQEKFYKIDLRKQLLSLAYGWSMAMGPPGLLLLTWLWIIGKFNKHYYGSEDDFETDSETDDSDSDWDDGYTSTDSNESNTAYN
ncbi:unnamed protein product [Caenorhabditis brenneri]